MANPSNTHQGSRNPHLIPQMVADGWSKADIVKYFMLLDDWAGAAEARKLPDVPSNSMMVECQQQPKESAQNFRYN